ncbi:hypothetical protein BHE90_010358 [Fusarium euwallaceae]|uniref:Glutathione S-transferase n=1 Tax=Fusarium euwallaceae TaxID=1147111 RepID=A0A430LHI1_9HYPO|nr:hypothetical protein BHE90_010358 [Fusarium euwallaceae]
MSQPEYELFYWPGFPGRGEFIRLLFEEADVPYSDIAKTPDKAMPTVMGLISTENLGDDHNPPPLAPPMLKHGDLVIHQLPNILLYLAPKLGLAPKEGDAVYHLNQISLTMLDGFLIEIHETHHPIAISLYYEDQKEEAKRRSKYFIKDRLPKYFGYMQRVLEAKTSGQGPWLYGDSLTYVDLVLFQCVDGTAFAFPKSVQALEQSGKYDDVFKLYAEVKARPNIAKYLASDRRQAYGNGIWRRYPELEED